MCGKENGGRRAKIFVYVFCVGFYKLRQASTAFYFSRLHDTARTFYGHIGAYSIYVRLPLFKSIFTIRFKLPFPIPRLSLLLN